MQRAEITREHMLKYLEKTGKALKKVKITAPEPSHHRKQAEDFLSMAQAYYDDANHFFKEGDYVNAFGCVNYSHGWLDAGARLGLFDVGADDTLFTLTE